MYLSTGLKQNNTQKERKAWHEFGALDPCQDTHRYQHIAPRLCRPGNKIAFAIRSAPFELLGITNSQNWMHHEYSNPQKDIYKNLKSESNMVVNCQTSSTIINNLYLCLFFGASATTELFRQVELREQNHWTELWWPELIHSYPSIINNLTYGRPIIIIHIIVTVVFPLKLSL